MSKKVYVLELIGDMSNTSGSHIIEIGGVSTDKEVLQKHKVKKDKELNEYLDDGYEGDSEDFDDWRDEQDDYEGEDEWCYMNTDYSSRPTWSITEYPLLKK